MPRCLDDDERDMPAMYQSGVYGGPMPDDYPPEPERVPFRWPETRDLEIAGLYVQLARLEAVRTSAYEDPMSAHAPMADFAEDWDRRERGLLGRLHRRGREIGDWTAVQLAADRLQAWMP